mmetsp:Transcript_48659/g.136012  ORF Transcript_48659/g.136012 Transcript_48659/m.136012 type:complete len:510 (-) Transcript_48659:256-1785(-)
MEDARALLDSIMGASRNAELGQRKVRKFSDGDICKKFLLGLCPHEMFKNTKMDLGPCGKHHNDIIKEAFEADADAAFYRRKWRGELRGALLKLLSDVDRRIETNQTRMARDRDSGGGVGDDDNPKIVALKEEVSEKLKKAERAADEGKFDESRAIMKEVDAIKRRIEDFDTKKSDKKKEGTICEVCGLMVSAEEAEEIALRGRGWHTDGKQHLGVIEIREKLKELEEQQARERRNGLRTPSPSPVRVQAPPPRGDGTRRKISRSRSSNKGARRSLERRTEGRRRSLERKSLGRGKRIDDRSRRPIAASQPVSPTRGRRRPEGRRRGSPSPLQQRSRSRGRRDTQSQQQRRASPSPLQQRSRSRGRHSALQQTSRSRGRGSRSRDERQAKVTKQSPPRRSPSGRRNSSPGSSPPPPPRSPPPPPRASIDGHRDRQATTSSKQSQLEKEPTAATATGPSEHAPQKTSAQAAGGDVVVAAEAPQPQPVTLPPRKVRFVLGLGNLSINALGKK